MKKYGKTIEFLVEKTGLPKRVMRYVVDHNIVPIDRSSSSGPGVPRTMEDHYAFVLVLGSALLHFGVKTKFVASLFQDDPSFEQIAGIYEELDSCKSAFLVVADGAFYQLRTDRPKMNYQVYENRWHRIREEGVKAEPVPKQFQPLLEIILDMKRYYTITTT